MEFWHRISLTVNKLGVKEKLEEGLWNKSYFEALASIFSLLKVKELCMCTSHVELLPLTYVLMNKTACSFVVCQEKWHKAGGKLVTQAFAVGTWGEMVSL